jgi:hypothetical protein
VAELYMQRSSNTAAHQAALPAATAAFLFSISSGGLAHSRHLLLKKHARTPSTLLPPLHLVSDSRHHALQCRCCHAGRHGTIARVSAQA